MDYLLFHNQLEHDVGERTYREPEEEDEKNLAIWRRGIMTGTDMIRENVVTTLVTPMWSL